MTAREKFISVVALVLIFLAGIAAYEWFQEHDAKIKAEAQTTVMENKVTVNTQAIDQAKKEFASANADQQRVIQTLQQQLVMIQAQRAIVPTPQQFVVDASKLIPNLPTPLKVQDVAATDTKPATQEVVIPKEDLPAFKNYKLDCDEKSVRLDACTQSSSDDATKIFSLNTELEKSQSNYELMAKDRDIWRRTAKGGSVLHRTATATKWIILGGMIGYAAHSVNH